MMISWDMLKQGVTPIGVAFLFCIGVVNKMDFLTGVLVGWGCAMMGFAMGYMYGRRI
jgi:hypothetical protein